MCQTCEWEDYVVKIEEMLDSRKYDWASVFLNSVHDQAQENEHISDGQKQGVDNIEAAGDR